MSREGEVPSPLPGLALRMLAEGWLASEGSVGELMVAKVSGEHSCPWRCYSSYDGHSQRMEKFSHALYSLW